MTTATSGLSTIYGAIVIAGGIVAGLGLMCALLRWPR